MSVVLSEGGGRQELAVTEAEIAIAREVEAIFSRDGQHTTVVPAGLADLVGRVIAAVARGDVITVGSMPHELSTSVAARLLGVSRPTLMKLIREGKMPSVKVGSHARVKTADVFAFAKQRIAEQTKAFHELRELEDQLGL